MKQERTCPRCGRNFTGEPALSRKDNQTYICPDCGTLEALEAIGASEETKAQVLDAIHRVTGD